MDTRERASGTCASARSALLSEALLNVVNGRADGHILPFELTDVRPVQETAVPLVRKRELSPFSEQ
jgi:hypothetical protein